MLTVMMSLSAVPVTVSLPAESSVASPASSSRGSRMSAGARECRERRVLRRRVFLEDPDARPRALRRSVDAAVQQSVRFIAGLSACAGTE